MVAAGGERFAVVEQAAVVGVAVGIVFGEREADIVAVAEGGGECGEGVGLETAAGVPVETVARLAEITAVVARGEVAAKDMAGGQGGGGNKEEAAHGAVWLAGHWWSPSYWIVVGDGASPAFRRKVSTRRSL